jgi:NAD(P)-dependent dehydrogenase (short-subunit alcohol dehydrogenase family)
MKKILVTGVTSGIGNALFHHFLKEGYFVIGVARSQAKLDALSNQTEENAYALYKADFQVLDEVVEVCKKIHLDFQDGIDALINNAAIIPSEKTMTEDGFELQYQVNHLSVVLLTQRLMPLVEKRNGKVLMTSSGAHKKAVFDAQDIEGLSQYHPFRSYARTKLYNAMYAHWLNKNEDYENVRAFVVSPGRVRTEIGTKDTTKGYALFWKLFTYFGASPEKAVKSHHFLISNDKNALKGLYYKSCKVRRPSSIVYNEQYVDDLLEKTLLDLKPFMVK